MAFTYTKPEYTRSYSNIEYALYKARLISRDTRENPPFSMTDEEWTEMLMDTCLKTGENTYHYQPYKAVHLAISTNPERLKSLTEASGSYNFVDIEQVKTGLLEAQRELNLSLNIFTSKVVKGSLSSIPVIRVW